MSQKPPGQRVPWVDLPDWVKNAVGRVQGRKLVWYRDGRIYYSVRPDSDAPPSRYDLI